MTTTTKRTSEQTAKLRQLLDLSYSKDTTFFPPVPAGQILFPFQRAGVEAMLKRRFPCAFLADPMGCISGDAEIFVNRSNGSRRYTMRELYKKSQTSFLKRPEIISRCRSFKNGAVGLHSFNQVINSGVKEVIQITLESGDSIQLTPDHEVLTTNGYVRADKLLGELVATDTPLAKKRAVKKPKVRDNCWEVGPHHPYARKIPQKYLTRVSRQPRIFNANLIKCHRVIYEAHINGLDLKSYLKKVKAGEKLKFIDPSVYVVHHINGNHKDNRSENLVHVTHDEHRAIHQKDYKNNFGQGEVIYSMCTRIENAGCVDTYDIICDEPYRNFVVNNIVVHNCGKTAQAIVYLNCVSPKRTLIICPLSLMENWVREIKTWSTLNPRVKKLRSENDDLSDANIILVSYSSVALDWCAHQLTGFFDVLICDEFHALKTPTAKRTKAVLKNILPRATEQIFISGTPILNRPIELYAVLSAAAPKIISRMTKNQFAQKFCAAKEIWTPQGMKWDMNGASNEKELGQRLRIGGMIRRAKKEVLPQLPEKIISIVDLPQDTFDEKSLALAQMEASKFKLEEIGKTGHDYSFDELSTARRLMGEAKALPASLYIETLLEGGLDKVVVFAHHKAVVTELCNNLSRFNPVLLVGGMSPDERQESIDAFQNDSDTRIFIGSISSAGVGITLTAAYHVCFVEWSWVPSENQQALDRCHRIGQKNTVYGEFLTYSDSLDKYMLCRHIEKQKAITEVMK